jgi:AhpD family alkylhydroperoxidase
MKALFALGSYVNHASLDRSLIELIEFRVSQINGCAYCLDMHSKDLRAKGETEQRLYGLDAWHEAPYYTDRERAALGWAEAVTNLSPGRVPDEVFQTARQQFSEEELVDLTMVVVVINGYNRINVAFRMPAGDYKVGQFGE